MACLPHVFPFCRARGPLYGLSRGPDAQLEGLPHFTRGLIEVPNDQVLVRELRLLERRTSRTGRDAVGRPPGGSDDCANAVFGLAYLLKGKSGMRSVPAANYTAAIQASNNALRGRPDPRAIDMYAIASGRR